MPKAPTANSCVKCTISSLGCSLVLRGAIDDLAVRIHAVAVRGTHLANHNIAQIVSRTASSDPLPDLPDVFNHSWWQQCFKAAANPQSGKEDLLHTTSALLFAGGDIIRLGNAARHAIETLSQDIVVNIRAMLTLNFHKQLRKAFRRDILCFAAMREFLFDAKDREKLVDYCIWRCVQQDSRFDEKTFHMADYDPPDVGLWLQAELDSTIDKWRLRYGELLPCPVPAFISNMKGPPMMRLYRWFIDLQRQRKRLHFLSTTRALLNILEERVEIKVWLSIVTVNATVRTSFQRPKD